jgi:ribonuclease T2
MQQALTKGFSLVPFLGCSGPKYNETVAGKGSLDNGRTELNEVWYYYHAYGRPQSAHGKKLAADVAGGRLTTCAKAKGAVWYYERTKGSEQ